MASVVDRLAEALGAEGGLARATAAGLLVYAASCTALLLWIAVTYTTKPIPAKGVKTSPSEDELTADIKLPTPEQTALLIRQRRSIFPKDLSGENVDRSLVDAMLEAANWAPTHGKTEPWRFVVMPSDALDRFLDVTKQALETLPDIEDREKKVKKLEGKRGSLGGVVYAIAICVKRQANPEKLMPEWEEMAATSIAVQNMHLMATALDVSGYWSSWYADARDSLQIKEYLGLLPEDRCLGVFLLGRSDRAGSYRPRRGPMAEKVVWKQ